MDHSSIFYLLDRRGQFVRHFTHQSRAEDIAAAVKSLL
jgi:protein SCO1/2